MELKLKELRKARKLTQEELGERVNQTARVIGAWERGDTSLPIDEAARIADVFDCTLDELAGRDFVPADARASKLSADERRVIDAYRATDDRGRGNIADLAQREAEAFDRGGPADPQVPQPPARRSA